MPATINAILVGTTAHHSFPEAFILTDSSVEVRSVGNAQLLHQIREQQRGVRVLLVEGAEDADGLAVDLAVDLLVPVDSNALPRIPLVLLELPAGEVPVAGTQLHLLGTNPSAIPLVSLQLFAIAWSRRSCRLT